YLVTGCFTGLGKAFAERIHNAGHTLVATARNTTLLSYLPDGPQVLKLSLNVTSNDSIAFVFNAAVKQFGRIDVVINNAGYV
ncbi:NAD(P)-binding protein, partial [Cadophora sp. DSE1049]